MKLVHKALPFEIKGLDEEDRSFWAVASTETPDRSDDVIKSEGWELGNFMKNPVIPWNHRYSEPPVAKALEVKVEGGDLKVKAKFPTAEEYDFADTVYKLYTGGYLHAFSVGFNPIEHKDREGGGQEYSRQELYEISCVMLPDNPEALVAVGKALEAGAISQEEADQVEQALKKDGPTTEELEAQVKDLEAKLKAAKKNKKPEPGPDGDLAAQVKALAAQVAGLEKAKNSPPEIDEKTLTSAIEKALPDAVTQRVEAAVKESLKYHLGQVD